WLTVRTTTQMSSQPTA
ncbi:hypothetical protein D043_2119B, partial [Vibrio parahaemolyticus EKP-021]